MMTILCCTVSGVLAATGLYILPYRRKVIKRDFRTAIDRVRPASQVFSTGVRSVWALVVADAPAQPAKTDSRAAEHCRDATNGA